jgi:hypothetical protein
LRILPLALAALAAAACAPQYETVALGVYDEWRPYGLLVGGVYEVEIDRPGHVAVIAVTPLNPAYLNRDQQTFRPVYPRNAVDSTYYPAGTHRLRGRQVFRPNRRRCGINETPTIDGCSYDGEMGRIGASGTGRSDTQYIVLVGEEKIDPYTVAHYLEEALLERPSLGYELFERRAFDAADDLAQAIARSPIASVWAGHYVVVTR